MSALSVGIFTYSTKPRGSVVHSANLAEALSELGHDVTLYALDKDGDGFFRPLRCKFVAVPALPAPDGTEALIAQRIGELARYLEAHAVSHDVLHAEDCLVGSALVSVRDALAPALLCRTVHHVEAFDSPFLEACQERSIRTADVCLSVSKATARDVQRIYQTASLVVENGVNFQRYAERNPYAQLGLRDRLGIPSSAPLVLSVGGVEERKNTRRMLSAFFELKTRVPTARWVIAGGASILEHGAYQRAFDAEVRALPSVLTSIHRVGVLRDADMPALFGTADVLLHASLHEGFGLCVLEAMAAGTPVVVSRGAPFDEFVDDSCASRVDPHDPHAIADALQRSLTVPAPGNIAAAKLRARAYSWQASAEQHVNAYRTSLHDLRKVS